MCAINILTALSARARACANERVYTYIRLVDATYILSVRVFRYFYVRLIKNIFAYLSENSAKLNMKGEVTLIIAVALYFCDILFLNRFSYYYIETDLKHVLWAFQNNRYTYIVHLKLLWGMIMYKTRLWLIFYRANSSSRICTENLFECQIFFAHLHFMHLIARVIFLWRGKRAEIQKASKKPCLRFIGSRLRFRR